jgi:hypothetical protein
MIKYIILTSLLLSPPKAEGGVRIQSLEINQQKIISNNLGILQPSLIISLNVGDSIKFYFPDGTFETGIVKSRKEEKDCIRVFGCILNKKDSGFGFGLTPNAFGGALVYRDTEKNKIYEAKFDDLLGGFIFRLKVPSVEL